jgi:predicted Zn-dependent protease
MCENHAISDKPIVRPLSAVHRRDLVRGLWAGTMVLVSAPLVSGCETISEAFEPDDATLMQLSAQAWTQTKAQTPISKDAKANQRLQSIGPKIASASGLQGQQWEFVVFDSAEKNAWVLPGGKVGFYKGLMDFCDNDDQVAAVLGHEVGHVVARHAAKRAGREGASQFGLALGGQALGTKMATSQVNALMTVVGAGVQGVVILPFSRENESEADRLGVDYMYTAKFDTRQSVKLWEKMAGGGASRSPEWLSTHPDPTRRAEDLKNYITQKGYAKF